LSFLQEFNICFRSSLPVVSLSTLFYFSFSALKYTLFSLRFAVLISQSPFSPPPRYFDKTLSPPLIFDPFPSIDISLSFFLLHTFNKRKFRLCAKIRLALFPPSPPADLPLFYVKFCSLFSSSTLFPPLYISLPYGDVGEVSPLLRESGFPPNRPFPLFNLSYHPVPPPLR